MLWARLWAGVPTISLPGIKQSSRVGASLLRGLGLDARLLARTHADYVAVAARALRSELRRHHHGADC